MASAYALAIFSGKIIFISRLSRPAGRDKRIFTSGVAEQRGAHFQSLNCFIINQSRRAEVCAAALATERRII